MSNSIVRLALVESVAKTFPCVSRWIKNVSIVPMIASPFFNFAAMSGFAPTSHLSLDAEK